MAHMELVENDLENYYSYIGSNECNERNKHFYFMGV